MTIKGDSTSNNRLNRSQREPDGYTLILGDISHVINAAKRSTARSINCIMTAAYWMIGQRMVEFEQKGKSRAAYGEEIIERLSIDLSQKFGRGFSRQNIQQMRQFYLLYPPERICQTSSGELENSSRTMICQTPSGIFPAAYPDISLSELARLFPLPWSAYVRLLAVRNELARRFYETEALRGGWSVRQLDRQINSQFYERTALSRNKAVMLTKGLKALPEDGVLPEEEIKDPYVLEFLDLKDEYSESDLEEALIRHLEKFLLELGGDFCFIGRQKRLRVGDEWYRVDLLFFHRRLRCLVIVDLKLGKFTHADAGQMHLYLNYAREHWARPDENPPVGLILCARNDESLARYTLENLPNKVMASEYRTALPDEKKLAAEIERTQCLLQNRKRIVLASSEKKKRSRKASDIPR
ncbi:MAG TPA: PDDEXK nuclease domain-containing protein [bacterium]|nr:PDDEXK nuclease domain-containing protein [bacterium]